MDYRIFPPDGRMEYAATMPPSKSETNRALIINALTPDAPTPENAAVCKDSEAIDMALRAESTDINIGAAGTAMRFLTAYFACQPGKETRLDGSERMRHRPIGPLVEALRACGAEIDYIGEEGYPPLLIKGKKLKGGNAEVDATISSQYVSALMMIAPLMEDGLHLELDGDLASAPYVSLTARMMRRAGADVEVQPTFVRIGTTPYKPTQFVIGGDWSAASYWYEIQALTCGFTTLYNLDFTTAQADTAVAQIFEQLGVVTAAADEEDKEGERRNIDTGNEKTAIELCGSPDQLPRLYLDFSNCPDLLQTVAVTAVMLGIPFRFTGAQSLRIKETDRLEALKAEMLKLGAVLTDEGAGVLEWDGSRRPINDLPEFDTWDDHRMAMSLAPVSLYLPGIVVRNAEVVDKSYPGFWDALRQEGFMIVDAAMPREEVEKLLAEQQEEMEGEE